MGESIACSDESATQGCAGSPLEQQSRPPAHLRGPAGVVESAVQVVHSGPRCRATWLVHLLHGNQVGRVGRDYLVLARMGSCPTAHGS